MESQNSLSLWRWSWILLSFVIPFLIFGGIAFYGQFTDWPSYTAQERWNLAIGAFLAGGSCAGPIGLIGAVSCSIALRSSRNGSRPRKAVVPYWAICSFMVPFGIIGGFCAYGFYDDYLVKHGLGLWDDLSDLILWRGLLGSLCYFGWGAGVKGFVGGCICFALSKAGIRANTEDKGDVSGFRV